MLKQEMGWHDEERNSTGALTAQLAEDARLVQGVSQSIVIYSIDSYSQMTHMYTHYRQLGLDWVF